MACRRTARTGEPCISWRVGRLAGLGLSGLLAELTADWIDWHKAAKLVQRGCLLTLALAIIY